MQKPHFAFSLASPRGKAEGGARRSGRSIGKALDRLVHPSSIHPSNQPSTTTTPITTTHACSSLSRRWDQMWGDACLERACDHTSQYIQYIQTLSRATRLLLARTSSSCWGSGVRNTPSCTRWSGLPKRGILAVFRSLPSSRWRAGLMKRLKPCLLVGASSAGQPGHSSCSSHPLVLCKPRPASRIDCGNPANA